MSKSDVKTLKMGLKRMALALATAALFALSVWGFFTTASAPGYLAVLLFLASVLWLGMSVVFLYAQGITCKMNAERKGEKNEWNIPL